MPERPGSLAAAVAIAALATFGAAPPASAVGPRIVSMNVCTDQALLTLADPDQILGLSRFSRDAWVAGDVNRYPTLSGGAEDVLVLKPDVVVASLFDKRSTRELLKANGLHLAELAVPRNLAEVKAQIRELGAIAGHPDRAAQQVARLDAALARARQAVADRHYRVLPLSRRGWVAGSDSFVGSLLAETGLFNTARELGFASGGFASLEEIVKLKPDLLLVSQAGDVARDDGQAFLLHPALERFYPTANRIVIPERLTECGGVMLAEALDVLVKELRRVGK
ncbi:ABC transporter substrate-binding protein [Bradyrhizobium sediminis]|uniref:ABC transporter substrate-binding protein n=1 Tax=Bradyrhizobium sediminis TaxID=2840469 RepID=A0A975NFX2_9BRAD|nr:ABC transporter substrate-binding protein [Bradyrhizobium sediminis]QWG13684.1 ABC transporter substrate-binding protein [Bradyrhizobium sediminis]QWG13734.1 ABC transporter substrate-binding protein [Bradyrhizobium sediminis]